MVLEVLVDLIWMFGAFCLNWWIRKSPNYDFEELVVLVIQVSEHVEAFRVLMLSEMFNIQSY